MGVDRLHRVAQRIGWRLAACAFPDFRDHHRWPRRDQRRRGGFPPRGCLPKRRPSRPGPTADYHPMIANFISVPSQM